MGSGYLDAVHQACSWLVLPLPSHANVHWPVGQQWAAGSAFIHAAEKNRAVRNTDGGRKGLWDLLGRAGMDLSNCWSCCLRVKS